MGSGDSIPRGEPAVGPPRSGFVLRLCIRKADEAWGEAALGHGLADTRFCTPRTASGAAFVTKLSADGSALVYSTYIGDRGANGTGIAVDVSGNAYVKGRINTQEIAFPTTSGTFRTTGPASAFVTKLNASGSGLVYSTYLGVTVFGSGPSYNRIAVDGSGNAYVVGSVNASSPFPTTPDRFSVQSL
jgi:hypothetical protein